jgi:hypothetical protein
MPASAASEQANFLSIPTFTWTTQSNRLAVPEWSLSCVAANSYIWCMGGNGHGPYTAVQYASVPSTGGSTGPWTQQSSADSLAFGSYDQSCVTANNYVYCMGGYDGYPSYSYVQSAQVPSTGGSTGPWTQSANDLAVEDYGLSCVAANSYIYCMGGAYGGSTVQYAQILGNGVPGPWTQQSSADSLAFGSSDQICVTANGYIYCMGGAYGGSTVQYAQVPSNGGSTGPWTQQSSADSPAFMGYEYSCVTTDSYVYCMGGAYGEGTTVQYAQVPSTGGSTGPWTQSVNSPGVGGEGESCVTANNYIYCMGGIYSESTVQYTQV